MIEFSVVARDLWYSYGRHEAVLRGANLSVQRGSICALLGLNGAGKTTLLRSLLGLVRPKLGFIDILGTRLDASSPPPGPDLLARVGYVQERPFPDERSSGRDLLDLVRSVHPHWDEATVQRYLGIFRIPLSSSCRHLSAGTKAQLALTLAMAGRPELLLLDEPTAGLDPLHRHQYLQLLLREATERDLTILITSHDLYQIERMADTVAILRDGQIAVERSLDELKESVKRVRVGVGAAGGVGGVTGAEAGAQAGAMGVTGAEAGAEAGARAGALGAVHATSVGAAGADAGAEAGAMGVADATGTAAAGVEAGAEAGAMGVADATGAAAAGADAGARAGALGAVNATGAGAAGADAGAQAGALGAVHATGTAAAGAEAGARAGAMGAADATGAAAAAAVSGVAAAGASARAPSLADALRRLPGVERVQPDPAGYILSVLNYTPGLVDRVRQLPDVAGVQVIDLSLEEIFLEYCEPSGPHAGP